MTRSRSLLAGSLLLALAAAPAAAQPARPPAEMDAYVQRVRETFDVPGIAVAVVKDGRVVLAKGFGVRDENRPEPVDARTLFGIASNTKAFTAAALGMLVEEGKLEWDAPVTRYLPGFALSDPYVTRELTVRDLLVHRSGLTLGAGDLLWWPANDIPRAELVRRLRHVPLGTSFRGTYAYDNVLYVAAGALVEEVSGISWEEFVQRRILDPVGMRGSTTYITRGLAAANVALPHAPVEGEVRRVKPYTGENGAPAAGIYASVEDMARWMIVQLDSGRVGSTGRLWSAATARQLWTPVTPMNIATPQPELAATRPNFQGYALGFIANDYRGRKVVSHTGGLPGYLTQVTLVPDLKLGIVVLTNQESSAAFRSITYRVMDHYMGAPRTDWVAAYRAVVARGDSSLAETERRIEAARDRDSRPSLPLRAYAGTYRDAWYGDVAITEADGGLAIRFAHTPWLQGRLEHWNHDTFVARWSDREVRADAFVTFSLNPDGSIHSVRMEPASPRVDFSFDFQDLDLRPVRAGAAR